MEVKCLVIDDDKIQRELMDSFVNETDGLQVTASFESAVKASNYLTANDVDLILLDIQMPIMSGLEFLKGLRKKTNIVLVSSEEKYALESYNFDVIDYLLKPVSYARFLQAVNKVKDIMNEKGVVKSSAKDIFVKVNSVIEKIKLADILFIEAAVDYVQIITSNGKFLVNTSMNSLLEKLPKNDFIRIHRSYIIRIDKISKIDGNLIVINDKLIRISRSYKDAVMQRINLI